MSAWINVINRRVIDVRVPILPLYPARNDAIRAGEPPQRRIVHPCIVEHQPKAFGHARGGGVVHVRILSRKCVVG